MAPRRIAVRRRPGPVAAATFAGRGLGGARPSRRAEGGLPPSPARAGADRGMEHRRGAGGDRRPRRQRPAARRCRARLRVALYRDFESRVDEASRELELPARHVARNVEALLGRFVDVSWAYRFGPPAQDLIVFSLERERGGGQLLSRRRFASPPGGRWRASRRRGWGWTAIARPPSTARCAWRHGASPMACACGRGFRSRRRRVRHRTGPVPDDRPAAGRRHGEVRRAGGPHRPEPRRGSRGGGTGLGSAGSRLGLQPAHRPVDTVDVVGHPPRVEVATRVLARPGAHLPAPVGIPDERQ